MTISDAIKGLRRLLPGSSGRGRSASPRTRDVVTTPDVWSSPPSEIERIETPLSQMLSRIEAAACAVYVRHGLPDRPGHYARSPKTEWRFLAEDLTVEERWALIQAQRPESGWRFGSLADIGAPDDNSPEVRRASAALRSCARLRARLAQGDDSSLGEDLEAAIHLGAAWERIDAEPAPLATPYEPLRLTEPLAAPYEPLRLTAPEKPRAPKP